MLGSVTCVGPIGIKISVHALWLSATASRWTYQSENLLVEVAEIKREADAAILDPILYTRVCQCTAKKVHRRHSGAAAELEDALVVPGSSLAAFARSILMSPAGKHSDKIQRTFPRLESALVQAWQQV